MMGFNRLLEAVFLLHMDRLQTSALSKDPTECMAQGVGGEGHLSLSVRGEAHVLSLITSTLHQIYLSIRKWTFCRAPFKSLASHGSLVSSELTTHQEQFGAQRLAQGY